MNCFLVKLRSLSCLIFTQRAAKRVLIIFLYLNLAKFCFYNIFEFENFSMNPVGSELYQSLSSFFLKVSDICKFEKDTYSVTLTSEQENDLKKCYENYQSYLSSIEEIKQCNFQNGFNDEVTFAGLAEILNKKLLLGLPNLIENVKEHDHLYTLRQIANLLKKNPDLFIEMQKKEENYFINTANIFLAYFDKFVDAKPQNYFRNAIYLHKLNENMQFDNISPFLLEKLQKFLISPLAIHYFGYLEKLKKMPREEALDWFKENVDTKNVEPEICKAVESNICDVIERINKKQIKILREKREKETDNGEETFSIWPKLLTNRTLMLYNRMDPKPDDWSKIGQCFFSFLHAFIEIYLHIHCFAVIYFRACSEECSEGLMEDIAEERPTQTTKKDENKQKTQENEEETKENKQKEGGEKKEPPPYVPVFLQNPEQEWAFETHAFGVTGYDINAMKDETAQYILDEKNWGDRKAMHEYVKTQKRSFRTNFLEKPLKTFRWITRIFSWQKCSCSWCGTMEMVYAGDKVVEGKE